MTRLVDQLIRHEILAGLREHAGDRAVWLVGGALRDHFLGLAHPDLDFVVDRDAGGLARQMADTLRAGYFLMDEQRDAARVVFADRAGTLDFVRLAGPSIESDLRQRDFTVNALALSLEGEQRLVDPLGGLQDLKDRKLRACAEDAILHDPVRALRAIRLASQLALRMQPATIQQIRSAADRIPGVSAERIRDEVMRILDGPTAGTGARLMDQLGLLLPLFPELDSPERSGDLERRLARLDRLVEILARLAGRGQRERGRNFAQAELTLQLGRFEAQLTSHLQRRLRGGRDIAQLLGLAALFVPDDSAAELAAGMAHQRAQELRLSRPEAARIRTIVLNYRRPARHGELGRPADGEIYRFYRATGEAGIEVVLLYLADTLASLGSAPPGDVWRGRVETARTLIEAWFERRAQVVHPSKLIAGDELATALGLPADRVIGRLLEAIREAQAEGRVDDRASAVEFARSELEREQPGRRDGRAEVRDRSR